MIYVDTVSGNLSIDTETESRREAIVITRNATGMHILCSKKVKAENDAFAMPLFEGSKTRAFFEKVLSGYLVWSSLE